MNDDENNFGPPEPWWQSWPAFYIGLAIAFAIISIAHGIEKYLSK